MRTSSGRTFLVLGALLFLGACSSDGRDSSSGATTSAVTANIPQGKVINGGLVEEGASPQILQLAIYLADGTQGVCTGTAVASGYVLSAAHCFLEDPVAVDVISQGSAYAATSIYIPSSFRAEVDLNALFDDVATVVVPGLVAPTLPVLETVPYDSGDIVTVYGYGLDENGDVGTLKNGAVEIALVTDNHIFSVPFEDGSTNPCNGDSGGPAIVGYSDGAGLFAVGIAGVVSTGSTEGCAPGDITLFTRLSNPSIVQFLRETVPGIDIR